MARGKDEGGKDAARFTLEIPLDASGLETVAADAREQEVRVVAQDRSGGLHGTSVKLTAGEEAKASLTFDAHPGALRIAIGPAAATDDEVMGLQTLTTDVATRKWGGEATLALPPIVVSSYWWWWWWRWCRTFTVRGRVTCPDGSPVPGAEVCAFDVDWWFLWSSQQQVGCATTNLDGTFEITFRWCCGWWPWWWWRRRVWRIDDLLAGQIHDVLRVRPDLELARVGQQPSLAAFEHVLGDETLRRARTVRAADVDALPGLRDRLLAVLPKAPQLEAFHVWPWYPWRPWWDCAPDLIFRVTQDCDQPGQVILQETIFDTRWNVDPLTTVNLVVSDEACCVPRCPTHPCDELDCLVLDTVCGNPFTNVGGNPGAAPTPVGYLSPGPVPADTTTHHRAFGGVIPIDKNPDDLAGVDYYEIEVFDDDPMVLDWVPLPPGAEVDFNRRYWDLFNVPHNNPALFKFQDIAGHRVVETRRHFEENDPLKWPDEPGGGATTAIWLSTNYSLLLPLDTTAFPDGTYRFRVVGWEEGGPMGLQNRRVIPVCGSEDDNEFVLTFDNRVTNAAAAHDPTHNCGMGVHLCTTEPDSHISAVRVNGVQVDPCDNIAYDSDATVEIDFLARDDDDHLGYYVLEASWGLNQTVNLLDRPAASVTPVVVGTPTGWAAGQSTGNYGTALTQGAVAPHWTGGRYTLSVPLAEAFPEPCCYQLELRAFKRVVVGYGSGCYGYVVSQNGNRTEYSLGVGVCGPSVIAATPIQLPAVTPG